MKRITSFAIIALFTLALLSACGGNPSSSAAPSGSSGATSSTSLPQPDGSGTSGSSVAESNGLYDVTELLATVSEAAGLGDTIEMDMMELTGSGEVDEANIVKMAAARSKAYATNGGMVIVIEATPGNAGTVTEQLQLYMDGILAQTENYQSDYPEAYEHISNARIITNGDYVVLAISATGEYTALDAVLDGLFA